MDDKDLLIQQLKAELARLKAEGVPVVHCKDCIHVDVCEQNPALICFSRDNVAYCKCFKDRQQYSEVIHGRWVNDEYCSECGCYIPTDAYRDYLSVEDNEFCYNCGAKMDLEK